MDSRGERERTWYFDVESLGSMDVVASKQLPTLLYHSKEDTLFLLLQIFNDSQIHSILILRAASIDVVE